MSGIDPRLVAERLAEVRARIASAGADPDRIDVLAVTKGFAVDAVRAAGAVGLGAVGENYAAELLAKAADLAESAASTGGPRPQEIRWHMIGRLQSNKVRSLVGHVDRYDSVDRPSLVRELARRDPGAAILVQVAPDGVEGKGGCSFAEAPGLVDQAAAAGLRVEGLLAVGVAGDELATGRAFERTRQLVDHLDLDVCSMGMTADLELAVSLGSTMVRVGTALFGRR